MKPHDEKTARKMAADVADAAIDALNAIKGPRATTSTLIDCMLSAISIAHVESIRAIALSNDIEPRIKSRVTMLATIGNAYSCAVMQLAQDPNTQWDDDVLFRGQLEHKLRTLFAEAKQFDMTKGSIL